MDPTSSPVSLPLAVGACTLFTVSFVGPLYGLKRTRIGDPQARDDMGLPYTRDHPSVIKSRLATTSLSMPVCAAGVWALARGGGLLSARTPIIRQVGLTMLLTGLRIPETFTKAGQLVLMPALLTVSLFTGPLYCLFLESQLPWQREWQWHHIWHTITSWQGIRNYIHAPVCEEFVFRACIIAASAMGGGSRVQLIFYSPLYFGFAHAHHAYEAYIAGGRTRKALKQGVVASVVQFGYTYLLGVYSSFLFLRSSSLIPPVVAHATCNAFGLPRPMQAIRKYPERRLTIWSAYVFGIFAFARGLMRLTKPRYFSQLDSLYWPH